MRSGIQGSQMSRSISVASEWRYWVFEVDRLSMTVTFSSRSMRASIRWVPMNPEPPVTRVVSGVLWGFWSDSFNFRLRIMRNVVELLDERDWLVVSNASNINYASVVRCNSWCMYAVWGRRDRIGRR